MSLCEINITKPILAVHLVNRNTKETYVFVGKKLLPSMKSNKTLSATEQKKAINEYGIGIKKWLNKNVTFIEDYINLDDSINLLRKKLFVYLSDPDNDYYLLENNQQIWAEGPSGKSILGFKWEDIDLVPSIYEKIKVDDRFVDELGIKINIPMCNKNGKILMDLIDPNLIDKYELYVTDLIKEIDLLKSKKVVITNKLKYGYLRKYYPFGNTNFNLEAIADRYKIIERAILKEGYITQLINNPQLEEELEKKDFNRNCTLLGFHIYVGEKGNTQEWVDLLKIFNYIRDEYLSDDIPFLKYKDSSWNETKCIIYKDFANEIKKKNLTEWIYSIIKNPQTGETRTISRVRGLLIRKKLKENLYARIHIFKTGTIVYEINYQEVQEANLKDIEDATEDLASFIRKINKIDFRMNRSIEDKCKFPLPKISCSANKIELSDKTGLIFKNVIQKYDSSNIKYEDFYNFIKNFYPYVIPYKFKSQSFGVELKYKKVSDFQDMNEIFTRINELKEDGEPDLSIVERIEIEFNKSNIEAQKLLIQWKKIYGTIGLGDETLKSSGIYIRILKNKITMMEAKSLTQLNYINKFILGILEIYRNLPKYQKDKEFRKFILDEKIEIIEPDVPEVIQEGNIENIGNYSNLENNFDNAGIDIENYLTDINGNSNNEGLDTQDTKALFEEDIDVTIDEKQEYEDKKYPKSSKEGIKLAPDNLLGKDVRLHCKDEEDYDREKDTCKDLCNDSRYFLRRLQRRETSLFHYKPLTPKDKTYSRACQENRQPVIMDGNPDEDPTIDKNSYYNVLKYGTNPDQQYYYMCPSAWCPYDEKPVLYSKVKNIRSRYISGKGECLVGDCPYGKHQLLIRTSNYSDDKRGLYVGFTSQTHPDGFCLPCCFKSPQHIQTSASYYRYKKCLDEDVDDMNTEKDDKIYIYKISLSPGKFGLLPDSLQKLFNTKCESGYLEPEQECYLRMGMVQNDPQSFLNCLIDIISTENNRLSLEQFKKYLLGKMDLKLFQSLNEGSLEIKFRPRKDEDNGNFGKEQKNKNKKDNPKSAFQNFQKFLRSKTQIINEEFMWDFLSREGILFPEGLNIFIFQGGREGIKLLCPVGLGMKNVYQLNRRSIFLMKYKTFFEPIYFLQNNDSVISITKHFSSLEKIVVNLYQKIKEKCIELNFINWNKILEDNEKLYGIKYKMDYQPEMPLNDIIVELKKMPSIYQIKGQVRDYYNKVNAIVLKNDTYLPIKPEGINLDYPIIENITLLPYNKLILQLKKITSGTKIPSKPLYKFLTNSKKSVIGIMLETGRIIPVKKSPVGKDSLMGVDTENNINYELSYYPDADEAIYEERKDSDERRTTVNKMDYEDELYDRLKYEISNYINEDGKHYKKDIMDIIGEDKIIMEWDDNNDNEESDNKNNKKKLKPKNVLKKKNKKEPENTKEIIDEKRQMIKDILTKIVKNLIMITDKTRDIDGFKKPNIRYVCFHQNSQEDCCSNPFCQFQNNKCKLFFNKKNLLTGEDNLNRYLGMISEELLRNKMKRDIILENRMKDIIDRTYLKTRDKDVIIDTEDVKGTLEKINKLYSKEPDIYIDPAPVFDKAEPDYSEIDRDKFMDTETLYEADYLKLEPLSYFWFKYLPNYQVLKTTSNNKSLYYSLIRILNQKIVNKDSKYTLLKLKNEFVNYISNLNKDVYKQLIKELDINLNIDNDLLEIYKGFDQSYYYNIIDFEGLKKFILLDSYVPNLVDVYLLAKMLKLNIIVLFKRKDGNNYFKVFTFNTSNKENEYIMLYRQPIENIIVYNLIQYQNNIIFDKNQLNKKFLELIFKKPEEKINVEAKAPLEGQEIEIQPSNIKEKIVKIKVTKKKDDKKAKPKSKKVKIKVVKKETKKPKIVKIKRKK